MVDEDAATRDRAEALIVETEVDVFTCASGEAAVEVDRHPSAAAVGELRPGIRMVPTAGTPETCQGRPPEEAVCTRRPRLPLNVLVPPHAALSAP